MRRKSERTASKKVKASPEKKVEKVKRTRSSRRRKQSETSENESAEETSPPREVVPPPEVEKTPVKAKEESPEEAQDQVWQVKTAQSSNESGEIGKLKLCLSRPPSTPERVDRSPRSRRKHSRATSSSDTPSSEGVEEKKKGRGRVKRSRESKDDSEHGHDTSHESQGDEAAEAEPVNTVTQSSEAQSKEDETPVSTTDESNKTDEKMVSNKEQSQNEQSKKPESSSSDNKASDADTTVQSPKKEEPVSSNETSAASDEQLKTPVRERSASVDKSEVLEIHANESKIESSEAGDIQHEVNESVGHETDLPEKMEQSSPEKEKVSITMDSSKKSVSKEDVPQEVESTDITNKNNVVEGSESVETSGKSPINLDKSKSEQKKDEDSETTKSTQEEPIPNGQAAPFVINRKRKWGARPRLTSQKSITISSDVLKEIIPDVKPVEFDEVIEEKKHKRIEVMEKFDRPVLPKIIIDNTENVEKQKKELEDRDKENDKKFEPQIGANRKISILNDNESILTRPPSPPRHKQSCILYITNLVRPFTLLQLKNLLQRTGRIVDDGFWIDRIKSKCFVKYETEDQAVETRHALHGVTWPVSNPKTLQVDFSSDEAFEKTRSNENADTAPVSSIPGTVEDWLREQDQKKERGEMEKPWERKAAVREWDVGKNEKEKEIEKLNRDNRLGDKRRHRSPERSPEPARKFKKKEEEAPAKLLDDLFRKTKTTPCIYWLPLSAETIAVKEEQRRQHMLEHERRMQELRRRRH